MLQSTAVLATYACCNGSSTVSYAHAWVKLSPYALKSVYEYELEACLVANKERSFCTALFGMSHQSHYQLLLPT